MSNTENFSRRRQLSSWLRQFSMRTQMVGAMLILSSLAIVGMAALSLYTIYSEVTSAEEERLQSLAGALVPQIRTSFEQTRRAILAEADFKPVKEALQPQLNRLEGFADYFRRVMLQHRLRDIILMNNSGVVVYCQSKTIEAGTVITYSPDVDTYGPMARTYETATRIERSSDPNVRVISSDLWFSSLFGDAVWIHASPVFLENGQRLGVVLFLTDPSYITSLLTADGQYEALKMGATGDIFLRGDDGTLKSGSRIRTENADGKAPRTQSLRLAEGDRAGQQASIYTNYKVKRVFGLSVPVKMGEITNFVQLEVDADEVYAPAYRIQRIIIGFCCVVIVGGLVFAMWFSGAVSGTLRAAMAGLESISTSARRTSHGFEEASERLSSACLQQAASLQEISSSHEEMTAMSRQNAAGAKKAADLTRQARETVKHCADDIARMIAAVDAIRTSSQDSMKVVRSIDEVAFRTKLIALNAAIEAARAEGQSGAAFSVVADEVRRLAQSSADAARGTSVRMEAVVQDAVRAAALTENVSRELTTIVRQVKDIDLLSEEIAHSSHEQALGFEQISKAVIEIDRVTQTAAAASSESAAAGRGLRENAADLTVTVQQLRMLVEGSSARESRESSSLGHPDEAGIISF
ncbi:MAG: methyl-accepting chemotaxis protein [Candidatus Methylacidiphilales bacterium]|nr:methyl-accepting chemotaxis protein [Candidatus Methylacidiphilales bacterium]